MKEKSQTWFIVVMIIMSFTAFIGYVFSVFLQENAYGRPNGLQWLSERLYNQVSASSYFAPLAVMCALPCAIWYLNELLDRIAPIESYHKVALLIAGANTVFEILQWIARPSYHDWHLVDMAAGWLAYGTFWLIYRRMLKR